MDLLRRNSVSLLADEIQDYMRNKDILKVANGLNKLSTKQGITVIDSNKGKRYLSHKYVYAIEHGLSLSELLAVIKFEVLIFEEKNGKYVETESNINALKNIAYKYNRALAEIRKREEQPNQEMIDSAFILYYVGTKVDFNFSNRVLTLTFRDGSKKSIGSTIFNEIELALLAHVQTTRINLLKLEKQFEVGFEMKLIKVSG